MSAAAPAAPAAVKLAGPGAGAKVRAPEAQARKAPASKAPASKAPAAGRSSRFARLLQGLLRGGRAGSAAGLEARAEGPRKAGARGARGAAETGQVRAQAAAHEAAVPARGRAEGQGDPSRAEGAEPPAGKAPRRTGRRRQEGLLEHNAPAVEKGAPAARLNGPAVPAGAQPEEGKRPAAAGRGGQPSEPRVFVVDLRRQAHPAGGAAASEPRAESAAKRVAVAEPVERDPASALKGAGFERQLARAAREAASPEPQPSLSRALQERVIPQIVQRTGIILRDGGEGEIRLVLKPEHLGAVRVRLYLGEGSLEGRIVVDNNIVKDLLEANLEHLRNALRQEGFASPNIEVSVGGGRQEGRTPADGKPAGEPLEGVPARQAREFERGTPQAWEAGLGYSTVNLFV